MPSRRLPTRCRALGHAASAKVHRCADAAADPVAHPIAHRGAHAAAVESTDVVAHAIPDVRSDGGPNACADRDADAGTHTTTDAFGHYEVRRRHVPARAELAGCRVMRALPCGPVPDAS